MSSRELSTPGYRNRYGGGVALYIRNTINYECMLNHRSEINLEWIAVKVITPNAKPLLSGHGIRLLGVASKS